MEELVDILKNLHPDVDFMTETALVDQKILDSFDLIELLGEIAWHFQTVIPPKLIVPANFNSVQAIWKMIEELRK